MEYTRFLSPLRGGGLIRQEVLALRYGLSERQKQAIQLAGEKEKFRIQDLEQVCPGVIRRTLQRELKELVEKGVLRVEGATRNLSYSLRGCLRSIRSR